ncbi:MAG: alcohol dehydrogenase catalytic domain-containing protein [Deltaproteobacteria bacterium]|nr:alcohol dehydrogenase catalytic domain-containing protein [Deltaproteobacteria bacterium]
MAKMMAAAVVAPGKVEIIEREIPVPGEGQVLVKIAACGICTLEKRIYTGALKIGYPLVGGHEVSGVIADLGPGIMRKLNRGDHVTLDLLNRCGECYYCREGHSNHCVNLFKKKTGILGGMAEYVIVSSREVFVLENQVPFPEATLTEPVATCIHSLTQSRFSVEHTALIIGAGTMGFIHLRLLKNMGIRVIVSDVDETRVKNAVKAGADLVLRADKIDVPARVKDYTDGMGCQTVIVTSPGDQPARHALDCVAIKGTVVFYSAYYPPQMLPLDLNWLHYKEVCLTGSESKTPLDFIKAVKFQNMRNLGLAPLISGRMPLAEAARAFELAMEPSSYRIILEM